jgi:NAD(P)-dependent dehydrogenase (short-subunit alcohol dehydrogenase family)
LSVLLIVDSQTAIQFDPKDMEFKTTDVPAYKLSKAMLNAYSKIVAEQLAKDYPNITVKVVDPGWYTHFLILFSHTLGHVVVLRNATLLQDQNGYGWSWRYEVRINHKLSHKVVFSLPIAIQ